MAWPWGGGMRDCLEKLKKLMAAGGSSAGR